MLGVEEINVGLDQGLCSGSAAATIVAGKLSQLEAKETLLDRNSSLVGASTSILRPRGGRIGCGSLSTGSLFGT